MEENLPAGDPGAERPKIPPGDDYEYDEAHDVPAGSLGGTPAPHRVDPPEVNLGAGGDYEYDEAHDFGASCTNQNLTSPTCRSLAHPAKKSLRGQINPQRQVLIEYPPQR